MLAANVHRGESENPIDNRAGNVSNYGPSLEIDMNFTKEQVELSLNAGLALTNPESDLLEVFRKHAPGVLMLRQLLIGIGQGEIALSPATAPDPDVPPAGEGKKIPPAPPAPPVPNKGPVAKKGARKPRKPKLKKK